MKEELLSSQKTFEIYRERARVSLKKTAADQKESDEKILQLNETLKTLEMKYHDSQTQLKLQEQQRIDVLQQLRQEVEHEKKIGNFLRKKLEECVLELKEIELTQEKLAESIHGNTRAVSPCLIPSIAFD